MGQAAPGLDGQVLELSFKNHEIQPIPSSLVCRWRSVASNPNTLIARLRTIVGWHDADDHGNCNDDRTGSPSPIGHRREVLPVVLLSSILASRLLQVLTTASGTKHQWRRPSAPCRESGEQQTQSSSAWWWVQLTALDPCSPVRIHCVAIINPPLGARPDILTSTRSMRCLDETA
jgi:hypothetical protein